MKNSIFACFAHAFFNFWHFVDVLVLSTTWNDQFCSWVEDMSAWWQMFNFVSLCPKRWFQLNSGIVRTHFSRIMSLNNWKMIAETQSYIFRWRSSFRWRSVCLSSLLPFLSDYLGGTKTIRPFALKGHRSVAHEALPDGILMHSSLGYGSNW